MKPVCPECGSVAIVMNKELGLGACTNHRCADYGKFKKRSKLVQSECDFPEEADAIPGGYMKRAVRIE